jgi:hypothetical protein
MITRGAHHEDLAMGEIDQFDDAVDKRIAERDERDQRAGSEADDQKLEEEGPIHIASTQCLLRPR